MNGIRTYIAQQFPSSSIEAQVYGGQLRFSLPIHSEESEKSSIAGLFSALEEQREKLGISYYSVSRSTLDQVFLNVCRKASVAEEGEAETGEKKRRWFGLRRR